MALNEEHDLVLGVKEAQMLLSPYLVLALVSLVVGTILNFVGYNPQIFDVVSATDACGLMGLPMAGIGILDIAFQEIRRQLDQM